MVRRRKPRELSSPLFGVGASRGTRRKWMRQGKRRVRRMERHQAKRELREEG